MPRGTTVVLSSSVAGPGEQRFAFVVIAVSTLAFLALAPFAPVPLRPMPVFIPIYQSALVINDMVTAVFLLGQQQFLRDRRVDRSGGRLSVHGADVDPARPDISRLVFAYRAIGCRSADHGVALYVLARRLSALRHRLRGLRHGRWRSSFEAGRDGCRARSGHCRRLRRRTPRHAGAGDLAADHAGQSAHGEYERRGVESVAVEPRRVGDAGAAAAVFGAGSVAHRDDVRVVVRHCGSSAALDSGRYDLASMPDAFTACLRQALS